jgi:hypothetical protein
MNPGDRVKITAHVRTVDAPHRGEPSKDALGQIATLDRYCRCAELPTEQDLWGVRLVSGEYVYLTDTEFEGIS